jgi:hypothetical protein
MFQNYLQCDIVGSHSFGVEDSYLSMRYFHCLANPSRTYLYNKPVFAGVCNFLRTHDPEYEGSPNFESSVTLYLLQNVTTP